MSAESRYIEQLFSDNGLVELRAQNSASGHWVTGIFSDQDRFRWAAKSIADTHNLYSTLNRPYALEPSESLRPASGGLGISDAEIEVHTRLPFDLDPIRLTGVSSSNDELQAAIELGKVVRRYFGEWPSPLMGSSGNGVHLQYRCLLPNNDETREQLSVIYTALKLRFSNDLVGFDAKVRNPSRIFRLYGTINRKGEATEVRPHRRTSCVLPSRWDSVSRGQVARLADMLRPKVEALPKRSTTRVSGDLRSLDIVGLFQTNGLYKRELGAGKHAVCCPWAHEHSTRDNPMSSDSVIFTQTGSGYPNFYCSHDHCSGRGLFECVSQLGGPLL